MAKQLCVVVGFHRSGTSLTTMLCHRAGWRAYHAEGECLGKSRFNPDGHFESRRLVRLNERMLEESDGAWYRPPHKLKNRVEYRHELRRIIDDLPEKAVIKDPRLCITLPMLYRAFPDDTRIVYVVRDRAAAADSLFHRSRETGRKDLTSEMCLKLRDQYVHSAFFHIGKLRDKGFPVFAVRYEHLMIHDKEVLRSFADFLGVESIDTSVIRQPKELNPS